MKVLIQLTCLTLFVTTGCVTAKKVSYKADADPAPARIEVNGNVVCESTPCEFWLQCEERWVGYANSSSGRAPNTGSYEVIAIPKERAFMPQYSDRKMINPCQMAEGQTGSLHFSMGLVPTKAVQPIQVR